MNSEPLYEETLSPDLLNVSSLSNTINKARLSVHGKTRDLKLVRGKLMSELSRSRK